MNTKWFLSLIIILLAGGLVGCDRINAVAVVPTPTNAAPAAAQRSAGVVAEGNIVPRDSVRLMTRTGGPVTEVLVHKGDLVTKDAVLVRFGDREQADAALAAARLEQVNAQQTLDTLQEKGDVSNAQAQAAVTAAKKALVDAEQWLADLDTTTFHDELDRLRDDVAAAKIALDDAQNIWDDYQDNDPASQTYKNQKRIYDDAVKKYDDAVHTRDLKINELDQAEADVENAKSTLADAQREAEKRKSGASTDDLALAQARLDNANAQVSAAQKALDDLDVRAPFDGTIIELDLAAGETLLPNQQVALIADLSELYVETTDLTEMDVVKISEGQTAEIALDALPDLVLTADVTEIARNAGKKGGDVTYTARLKLNQVDDRLRWGMTVEARFQE